MLSIKHISFFVSKFIEEIGNNNLGSYCCEILKAIKTETLKELILSNDENDPLWKHDIDCTKEQIIDIMIEIETEIYELEKEIEDLQR